MILKKQLISLAVLVVLVFVAGCGTGAPREQLPDTSEIQNQESYSADMISVCGAPPDKPGCTCHYSVSGTRWWCPGDGPVLD